MYRSIDQHSCPSRCCWTVILFGKILKNIFLDWTILTDEFCEGYPHNFTPTPGYWIECSRQSGRGRRNHGIQEEGSQDDSSRGDEEEDDEDDEDDEDGDLLDPAGQAERTDQNDHSGNSTGDKDATSEPSQHANGGTSVFTSTESAPSDRTGRKVQLVHQHIQVPVDGPPPYSFARPLFFPPFFFELMKLVI